MTYPDRWNAIHRLVIVTEGIANESIRMDDSWSEVLNPFSHRNKSGKQKFLEKNVLEYVQEKIDPNAKVGDWGTSVNLNIGSCGLKIYLFLATNGYADENYKPPNNTIFWEITWKDVLGNKQTRTGYNVENCNEIIENMHKEPTSYQLNASQ